MRISRVIVGLAVIALLGACDGGNTNGSPGSSSPSRPGAATGRADPATVFRQVADCFRAHGHPDFPDPVQGKDGTWGFPPDAERVTVPDECADIFRQSKALNPNPPKGPVVNASDMITARKFAQCMRDNGLPDWPDPNADGTYTVPDRLVRSDAEDLWQPTANGPCKQYAPAGGAVISVPHD
jgi:hypothetical protein